VAPKAEDPFNTSYKPAAFETAVNSWCQQLLCRKANVEQIAKQEGSIPRAYNHFAAHTA